MGLRRDYLKDVRTHPDFRVDPKSRSTLGTVGVLESRIGGSAFWILRWLWEAVNLALAGVCLPLKRHNTDMLAGLARCGGTHLYIKSSVS